MVGLDHCLDTSHKLITHDLELLGSVMPGVRLAHKDFKERYHAADQRLV